jgi:hypothetical protein
MLHTNTLSNNTSITYLQFLHLPPTNLQLRRSLRLLQHTLHLSRLHHIPLNLQLATHKQLLRIRLALHQLAKVLVAQEQGDGRLLSLGRYALAHGACLLEVNVP